MDVTVTWHKVNDDVIRLAPVGEVDMSTVGPLRDSIAAAIEIEHAAELIVDLERVSFLDSSGIAALVAGRNSADVHAATYRVVNPRPIVRRTLKITGVLDLLTAP